MTRNVLFFVLMLGGLMGQEVCAQERVEGLRHGGAVGSSVSWSGLDASWRYEVQRKAHLWYLGPRLLLSDSYLPLRGPWGLSGGYRLRVLEKERLSSFVELGYKAVFSKPYDPLGIGGDYLNSIHETHLSYGFQYRWPGGLGIGSSFGAGFYIERLADLIETKTQSFSGYSAQLALFVSYQF